MSAGRSDGGGGEVQIWKILTEPADLGVAAWCEGKGGVDHDS